jgi:hypothetical protein
MNVQRTKRATHKTRLDVKMSQKTLDKSSKTTKTTNETPTQKSYFTLAQLSRDLKHNPKIVRSRFRRYANDETNVERQKIVNSTLKNAKSRWVYPIALIDAIREIIKRDDDD